MTGDRAAL